MLVSQAKIKSVMNFPCVPEFTKWLLPAPENSKLANKKNREELKSSMYPLSFGIEHFGVAGEVHLHAAVLTERHCHLL